MELDKLDQLLELLKRYGVTEYKDKSVEIQLAQAFDSGPEGLTEIPVIMDGIDFEETN